MAFCSFFSIFYHIIVILKKQTSWNLAQKERWGLRGPKHDE